MALAGASKSQIQNRIVAAIASKAIPLPRPQFFVQLSWHGVSGAAFQK